MTDPHARDGGVPPSRQPAGLALARVPSPPEIAVDRALADVRRRATAAAGARPPRRRPVVALAVAALLAVALGAAVVVVDDDPPDRVTTDRSPSTATTADPTTDPSTPSTTAWTTGPTVPLAPPTATAVEEARRIILDRLGPDSPDADLNIGSPGLFPTYQQSPEQVIDLRLRADGWALAGDIWALVDHDAVRISVGLRQFPTGEPTDAGRDPCPEVVSPSSEAPFTATIDVDGPVRSGADARARLTVRADDDAPGATLGAWEQGFVVHPGTTEVVGVWLSNLGPQRRVTTLAAGEEASAALLAGTARCGPDGPPNLPPGDYEVVWATIPGEPGGSAPPPGPGIIRATAPLTIVP